MSWSETGGGLSLALLAGVELVATELSHSLAVRLALAQSLTLALLGLARIWPIEEEKRDRREALYIFLSSVFLTALCFVSTTHAAQMLVHRHDVGVHHAVLLVSLGVADLLLKIPLAAYTTRRFGNWLWAGWSICPAVAVSLVSGIALASPSDHDALLLYFDPAITIFASVFVAAMLFPLHEDRLFEVGEVSRVLLLSNPKGNLSPVPVLKALANQFPEGQFHELHLWEEAVGAGTASVHVLWNSGTVIKNTTLSTTANTTVNGINNIHQVEMTGANGKLESRSSGVSCGSGETGVECACVAAARVQSFLLQYGFAKATVQVGGETRSSGVSCGSGETGVECACVAAARVQSFLLQYGFAKATVQVEFADIALDSEESYCALNCDSKHCAHLKCC